MRERACCKRPGEGQQADGAASLGRDGSAQEITVTQPLLGIGCRNKLFCTFRATAHSQPNKTHTHIAKQKHNRRAATTRPLAGAASGHAWWHLPSDSKHASLDDAPAVFDFADEDVAEVASEG